ncbi:50S ribosomal protein L29 [Candidatus Blochmannia ocreatus (nom. nud.)]|uniref:Large ribosomal subunit protein uL29 n=1 Tax=Candidatus Blochmannia ocreatus (nom. nud.) TaxID=251538 RepID=A0ABY4SWV4_9ENTR|nr:50S ribosomal protein L29 [Candidatus Blochmannia ocreatus]URJ25276.1 50S ribosomal protein L29 [Candidatus Blochmannia ocreatus]
MKNKNKLKKIYNEATNNVSSQLELINMLREYFNLRLQLKSNQLKQPHLLKKVRRNIASLKHYLSKNNNI